MQLFSLNSALHYDLPVIVLPLFFTLYTCSSIANTMVFLNRIDIISVERFFLLLLGIAVTISGVFVLTKVQNSQPGHTESHAN
jgi:hypothetical protein